MILFSTNCISQLEGRVIDEQNEGISNATVILESANKKKIIAYKLTDKNGYFFF